MEKAKKFGAFAGVFTPSVLTILCVIMYMRLGWIVGQGGLIGALVIIVLAHVISISTGLSISSIATDKKIKAGGIYYILSRSLGLPIGGAIGIALLIGTALSISLYLIGFAESFLGLEVIRNFTGLEQNVIGIRIVGTGAIVILVIIALISTSIAIKTQFYIMAAIGLSLVSIVIGFFINGDLSSSTFSLSYLHDGVSPEVIFAIFFPAVTGFTAGVAMSGDLKNPNKAIPRGTLAAIAVGFFVYVSLATGFALFVDRELLLTDYNFLMKIAWFAPVVVAGIWGATLSSAMGGILG
ncbi:MAG: Na-K-Cl cotransporter, partial [Bacteroidia bacterium]|nr:Na-K-Cl cotransporter [Bacteroidia bacterium]